MNLSQTSQFKRDIKRRRQRGKDLDKIKEVINLIVSGSDMPPNLRDHALTGNWKGWRDCHVEPDWLLIYQRLPEEVILGRTGTHSDLF